MREVTKDELYQHIGHRDVICDIKGPYPYTVHFKLRHGPIVAKKIDRYCLGYSAGPTESRYFIGDI